MDTQTTPPTDDIAQLDEDLRRLHRELDGVRGAVLQRTDPAAYRRKREQYDEMMRRYYRLFFGGSAPGSTRP